MVYEFPSVKTFARENNDLYGAMKEYAKNCILERKNPDKAFASLSKDEMSKLINKEFALVLQNKSSFKLSSTPTNTEVKAYSGNPMVKYFANEIRNALVDMILPEVLLNGSLRYFADFKFAELGDTLKIKIENNALYNVSLAGERKKHTNLQQLFPTTVTMFGLNHQITVGTNLYEILIGNDSIAKDVMKAALSIEAHMLYEAYDVFESEMSSLTGNLNVANYSEKALITLCETVTAWNQGKKAIILGTPVALKSVLPSNGNFRFLLNDDYVKSGALRDFNGYDVVPMSQVADYLNPVEYSLKLNDQKIYVVSPAAEKIVTIGLYGGTQTTTDDVNLNPNKAQLTSMEKHWSTVVATNSIAGVVTNLG